LPKPWLGSSSLHSRRDVQRTSSNSRLLLRIFNRPFFFFCGFVLNPDLSYCSPVLISLPSFSSPVRLFRSEPSVSLSPLSGFLSNCPPGLCPAVFDICARQISRFGSLSNQSFALYSVFPCKRPLSIPSSFHCRSAHHSCHTAF